MGETAPCAKERFLRQFLGARTIAAITPCHIHKRSLPAPDNALKRRCIAPQNTLHRRKIGVGQIFGRILGCRAHAGALRAVGPGSREAGCILFVLTTGGGDLGVPNTAKKSRFVLP